MQLGTASSADASKMIPLLNPLKDSGYRGEGEPFDYGNLGATLLANVQPAPPPRPPSKYSPLLDRMDLSGGRRRAMSESTDGTRAQQQRPSLAICPPGLDIPEAAISPTTTIDSMSLWSPSTTATTLHDTPMTRKNSATSGIQSATTTGSPIQHLQPGSQSFAPGVEHKVSVEESSIKSAKSDQSMSGGSRQSLQRADANSSSSIRSGSTGTNSQSGSKTSTGAMSSLFMNKYADVTTSAAFELDDLATAYARQRKRAATMGHTTQQQQQQHQKQRQLSDKPLTPGTPTHSTGITSSRNPAQSTHISSGGLTPSSSGQRVLSASNSSQPSLLARMVAENRKSRELSDQTLRDAMESQTKGQQQQSSSSNATSLLPPGAVTPTAVGSTSPGGTVAQSLSSMATTTSTPTATTLESNTTKPCLTASSQTPIVKPTKPTLYLYTNSHDAINSQQPQSKQKSKNPKDRTRVTEEANKVYREFIKIQPATHSRAATGLLLAGKIMFDIDNEWAGLDEVVAGSDEHGLPPRLYYPTGHVVDRFMLISGLVYPNEAAETTTTTKGDSALEAAHQNPNQDQQQDPKVQEGTALAESFAIWRHNLETHEWTRLELTKSLSNGRWHRSVLDSKANMLYVLGKKNAPTPPSQPPLSSTSSSIESAPHENSDGRSNNVASVSGTMDAAVGASDVSPIRTTADDGKTSSSADHDRAATTTSPSSASPSTSMALCFEHLVEVDLEGLDMPRGLEVNAIGPLGIQMGLEMLREGVGSDCVLVSAIDGGRVRVNSAIVGQRWGRFQRVMKDYERTRDLKARERLNENGEGEKGKEEGVAGSSGKVPGARKDKENDEKQDEGVALTNVDQEDDTSASQKTSTSTEKREDATDAHADSSEKNSEGDQDRQATTNLAARERQWYLNDEPPEWQVPETTPILVAFLQYCYTNTLSTPHQLKLKTLQGLLLFAHTHDLTRLRQLCLWALAKHHLTAANAPQICETATLTGAFGLQTRALRVLLQTARLAELRRQSEANEYRRRLEFAITHMQAIEEDRRRLAIQQAQREAWKQGFTLGPAELLAAAQSATAGGGATDRIGSLMKGLGNSSGNSMGTKSPLSSPTNLSTVERAGAATTHTSLVSRLFKSSRDEGLDTAMAGAALATTAAGVGSGSVSPDSSLQQNSGHRRTLSIGAALHPRGLHSHDSQQQSSQQVSPQLSPQSQPQPPPQHVLFVQGPAAPAKTLGPQPVDLSIRPEDAEKWMTLVSKIQQGEPLPCLSALGLIEGDSDLATRIEGSGDSGANHAGTGSDTVHGSDGLRGRPSMKRSTESMLLADAETEVVDSDDQPTEDGCDDEENEEEEEEEEEEPEGEENEAEDSALGELQVQQQQQQLLSGTDQGATTTTPSNDMISTIKSQRMRVASHDDSKRRTQEEASAFPSASSSSSSSSKSHLRSKSLHHLASVVTAAMTGSSRRPLASSSPSTGAEGNVSSTYSAKDKEKDKKKKLKKAKKNKSDLQLPTTVEEEGTPTSGSGSQSSSCSNVSTLSLASSARNCPEPRGSLSTSSREMSVQQQQQQAGLPLHRTESFGSIENRELPSFLSLSSSSFFNTSGRHAPTTAATSAAMPPPPPLSQQPSHQRSTRHSFHLNLSNAFPFLNNSASSSSSSLVSASSMASPAAGTPIGGSGTGQPGGSTNNSGNSSNKPSLSWLSFRSSSVPNTPSAGMVEPLASATTTAAGSTMQAMNHKLLQQQLQQQLQEQQLSPWQLPPPRFDDEPMDYFRYSHYTTTIPETEEDSGSSSGSGGGHVEVIVSTPTPTASRYPTSGTASSGSMTKPMLTPPSAAGLHAGAPSPSAK
ncbi:hypothetical protein BGW42_002394 [Actinomortierella wolfii]|nr:hypothetical protein BGW42_002394 [Actinomortierella wolfii]